MKKEHIVEIFILLFLLICVLLISFWAYRVFFADKNSHILYFKDVDGIVVGSPVRFMGVVVGHVSNLKYEDDIINVKILITKKGVEFPKGSRASVQFTGLAGSKSIEITPPKDDVLPYSMIITENPLRVKDIFEYSRSFTNALLSIESQIELVSTESMYKIVKSASIPYDWSNIDDILDGKTNQVRNVRQKVNDTLDAEKEITDQINKINKTIQK